MSLLLLLRGTTAAGDGTASPAAKQVTVTVPTPAASGTGAGTAAPAAKQVTVTIPTPSASGTGGAVFATPAAKQVTITVPSAAVPFAGEAATIILPSATDSATVAPIPISVVEAATLRLSEATGMVTPARQDLAFTRGDDYAIDLTMTTNGSTGISVSGWSSIAAQVRATAGSTASNSMTVAIQNTSGGVIRFSLTSGQTSALPAACVWDIQRVSSGALQTVVAGNVTVRSDVTRT